MMVIMAFIAGRRRHQAQSCVTLKARLKPCTAIRRGIVSAHLQRPGPPAGPPRCVARGPSGTPGLRPPAQGPGSPDAGNTLTRNVTGGKQTLTWAHDGKLATDTTPAGTTSYVYDADSNLLLQKDPGQTTFYPFGGAEQIILNATTGAVTGTRFLALPGDGLATPVATPSPTPTPPGSTGSARPTATAASPTARPRSAAMRVLLIEIIGTEIRGPGTFIIVRISARSSDRAAGRLAAGGRPASSSSAWQMRRRR